MKRRYYFCIFCATVLAFCGCAKTQHMENGNRSDGGNSVSNETGSSQTENGEKSDAPDSNDVMSGGSETKMLTEEEAKEKALDHAGLNSSQVTFVQCKLDYEDSRQIYEVEFYTGDNKEFDYEIDAYTGEIVGYDYDADNYMPQQTASGGGNAITEEAAKKLALDRVPGASGKDIREFKMEREDGCIEYEGKIIYEGMEYEFEIDADSGAFIDWEQETAGH